MFKKILSNSYFMFITPAILAGVYAKTHWMALFIILLCMSVLSILNLLVLHTVGQRGLPGFRDMINNLKVLIIPAWLATFALVAISGSITLIIAMLIELIIAGVDYTRGEKSQETDEGDLYI